MSISFASRASSSIGPATRFSSVTPDDAADLPGGVTRCLHVAGAGLLAVRDEAGNEAVFASSAGQYHPLRVARVLASGTTATGVVALY